MPTYQYACTACDHRFEQVQTFSDSALSDCPECAGALRKVFSSIGIVFKGSGFYHTDNRAKDPKDDAKTDAAGKRGTSPAGSEGSPAKSGSEGSPAKSGSERSPAKSGSERPPAKSGSDGPPAKSGSDGPPAKSGSGAKAKSGSSSSPSSSSAAAS